VNVLGLTHNLSAVVSSLKQRTQGLDEKVGQAAAQIMVTGVGALQESPPCPVKTGNYKAGFGRASSVETTGIGKRRVHLGTDVPYGEAVNARRPHISPVVHSQLPNFRRIAKEIIGGR
jgi:hypothetical protein